MNTRMIADSYKKFCYRVGRRFDQEPSPSISRMIYQADLEMTPGLYTSLWLITTLICGLAMGCTGLVIFMLPMSPFHSASPFLFTGILGMVGAAGAGIGFPFYLQSKISNKKMDIERQLPYALAFMSILASSGATPLDIIRRLAREDYGHISNEFKKVLFRVDILGEDVVTAMHSLINHTPSELFRDLCIDMTNIIYSGGGLKEYLETKSKELMNIRRQTYREFVDSLSIFGEGYLGGVVMLIIFAVLGIVISGALGIELGPFTPAELFNYLVYLIIPLVNVIFLLALAVKYSTNP
jgi:archaeal flagellar protein FlaJ